jgi:hypothetical protein
MFLAQISYNFCTILTTFFLRSTIGYLRPTCRKTDTMVHHKKKKRKEKKLLELYESCTTIFFFLLEMVLSRLI